MTDLSAGAIAGIVIGSVVVFLLLLWAFLYWYTWRRASRTNPSVPREATDPQEYAGKWYEVASNPAWFQTGCTSTTATYVPEEDGSKIRVLNRCFRNGRWEEAKGWAYPTRNKGVLAVSFFPGIYGNYTVTYREPRISVVTDADKKYLWILSRDRNIARSHKERILEWLHKHDFDTTRLQFSQGN